MTFAIDTGITPAMPNDELGIPDWFIDLMDAGATPERTVHQYAYHLIGKISEYRSINGARAFLLLNFGFFLRLGKSHPEIFDEAMAAYAEAIATLEHPRRAVPGNEAKNEGI